MWSAADVVGWSEHVKEHSHAHKHIESISMNRKLWSLSPPDSLALKKSHYLIRTYCAKAANASQKPQQNEKQPEWQKLKAGVSGCALSLSQRIAKSFLCSIVCTALLLAKGQALLQSIKGRRNGELLSGVAGWDSNSDFLLKRNQMGGLESWDTGYRRAQRPRWLRSSSFWALTK